MQEQGRRGAHIKVVTCQADEGKIRRRSLREAHI